MFIEIEMTTRKIQYERAKVLEPLINDIKVWTQTDEEEATRCDHLSQDCLSVQTVYTMANTWEGLSTERVEWFRTGRGRERFDIQQKVGWIPVSNEGSQ